LLDFLLLDLLRKLSVEQMLLPLPVENLEFGRRASPCKAGPEEPESFEASHDVIENK
jgi:hypothetical protein